MPSALRVYIDTSVFGGYFDREFEEDSGLFFQYISAGRVVPVVSGMVMGELARAPLQVQTILEKVLDLGAEIAPTTEETVELQEAYLHHMEK